MHAVILENLHVLATLEVVHPKAASPIPNVLLPAMVFGVASFTISLLGAPYLIKLLRCMSIGKQIR